MSPLFRAAQTGFTQNYALVMVLGLVAAVALFFGADIAGCEEYFRINTLKCGQWSVVVLQSDRCNVEFELTQNRTTDD